MVPPDPADEEAERSPRPGDEAAGPQLEALIRLFAEAMECTAAMLLLAEPGRFVPRASVGTELAAMPWLRAFCDATLRGHDVFAVEDTRTHPLFRDHPIAVWPEAMRFCIGMPLALGGVTCGVLCAMDHEPRQVDAREHVAMRRFALVAQGLLRDMLAKRPEQGLQLRFQNRLLKQAARMARLGAREIDLRSRHVYWSELVYRLHDLAVGTPISLADALQFYPEHERARIQEMVGITMRGEAPLSFEADFVTARGRKRRLRALAEIETEQGAAVRVVGIVQDVTENWRMMRRLRKQAHTDGLTGLGNRTALFEQLETLRTAPEGQEAALFVLDLDGFQDLNDRHGHHEGDRVLSGVAQRLRRPVPAAGFAACTGSDEFALLLRNPGAAPEIRETAQRMAAALHSRLPGETGWRPLSASIGVARWPHDAASPIGLLRQADMALSDGRRQGKARITLFSPAIATQFQQRRMAIDHVQRALAEDRLRPFYQPKLCLATGRLVGFEALMRIIEPDGTVSGPAQVWPALEEPGTAGRIIETRVRLAHGLGLEVVAEGVESGAQHRLLQRLGCHVGQGHHYGMALPSDAVRGLLAQAG